MIKVVHSDLKRNMFYCRAYKHLTTKGTTIGTLMRAKKHTSQWIDTSRVQTFKLRYKKFISIDVIIYCIPQID